MNKYYNEFINFFKKHNLYDEKMFEYINNNSTRFDYRDEEQRMFIGCYYICNKQEIIQKIKIIIPFISDQKTILVNIHEYIHAIELYNLIGKKYKPSKEKEALPMLYEQLYYLENPNDELEEYLLYLNNRINKDTNSPYKTALELQKELLEYYYKEKPKFKKLQKKAKKLSKKYK